METIKKAVITEQKLHDDNRYPFDSSRAALFSVKIVKGEVKDLVREMESPDIYHLLESSTARKVMKDSKTVMVATCGWAAPIDDDDDDMVAPSQHPRRRRVRLMSLVDSKGVATVLRFKDEPDNIIEDNGVAHGSLAEALLELRKALTTKKKGNK
jgi:hypothetical protein